MTINALPIIQQERCTRCGACITGCPQSALTMEQAGPVFNHSNTCNYCTDCEALCPEGAIRAPLTVRWAENT